MLKKSLFVLAAGSAISLTSLNAANYSIGNISEQESSIKSNSVNSLDTQTSTDETVSTNDSTTDEANQAIVKQIQSNLKNTYRNFNVNIRVKDGKVFLTGSVSSDADRSAIEADVKNISGVQSVKNELEVRNTMTPSPRA